MQCSFTRLLTYTRTFLPIFFLPHKCSLLFVVTAVCSQIDTTITLCFMIHGCHLSGSHVSLLLFQKLSGFTNSVSSIEILTRSEETDPSFGSILLHGWWHFCAALPSAASGLPWLSKLTFWCGMRNLIGLLCLSWTRQWTWLSSSQEIFTVQTPDGSAFGFRFCLELSTCLSKLVATFPTLWMLIDAIDTRRRRSTSTSNRSKKAAFAWWPIVSLAPPHNS